MQSWQQQRATELTTLQEHHERELAAMSDRLRHELAAAAADAERRVQHAQTQAQAQAQQRHAEAIAHERQSQSRSAVAHEVQSRVDGSVSCDRFFNFAISTHATCESNALHSWPNTHVSLALPPNRIFSPMHVYACPPFALSSSSLSAERAQS